MTHADRVRVRFVGSYVLAGGPCYTRGECASLSPAEAADVLRRGLGVPDPPPADVASVVEEAPPVKAFDAPPAHTQITRRARFLHRKGGAR